MQNGVDGYSEFVKRLARARLGCHEPVDDELVQGDDHRSDKHAPVVPRPSDDEGCPDKECRSRGLHE